MDTFDDINYLVEWEYSFSHLKNERIFASMDAVICFVNDLKRHGKEIKRYEVFRIVKKKLKDV